MAGTKEGARKAAITNMKKYGEDFYKKIGGKGGSVKHPETRAFRKNKALAIVAGAKGGRNRTGWRKKKEEDDTEV